MKLGACSPVPETQMLICVFSEQDLQSQLALTRNQLKELRSSNETNQAKLLDQTQRQGMGFTTLRVRSFASLHPSYLSLTMLHDS